MSPDPHPAGPRLVELQVADDPGAWESAGFIVDEGIVRIGDMDLRLTGRREDARGIVGWTLSGLEAAPGDLDGLRTKRIESAPEPASSATAVDPHPNGTIGLDHVVVATPDLDRTIDALATAGLDLRRIRDTSSSGAPMRQAFFRLGPTVLEVVGGARGSGQAATEAPATWFGLAVDVDDLDHTAAHLGEGLGTIKAAVQPGRRIATVRHKAFGMSVAVAAMDHHADR